MSEGKGKGKGKAVDDVAESLRGSHITTESNAIDQNQSSSSAALATPRPTLFPTDVTIQLPPQKAINSKPTVNQRDTLHDVRAKGFPVKFEKLEKVLDDTKLFAERTSFAETQDVGQIYTNHFKVTLPEGVKLYEYGVNSDHADWTDTSPKKRKVLIRTMIDTYPELYNNYANIATDFRTKIISIKPLFAETSRDYVVKSYQRGVRQPPQDVGLKVDLNHTYEIDQLRSFVMGQDMTYQEQGAVGAMNIIVSKAVTDGRPDTFSPGDNNKFFYRPGWEELGTRSGRSSGPGLVTIRGYSCSLRPCMGSVTLNINTATSAFFNTWSVEKHIANFGSTANAKEQLKGLRVYVNFDRQKENDSDASIDDPKRRTKTISSIEDRADLQVMSGSVPPKTVWKHLAEKYTQEPNVKQRRSNQLAVNVGGARDPHKKFYLSGQLDVISDQPFRGKLPPELIATMIKTARKLPTAHRAAILSEGLASLGLSNNTLPSMLNSLGITIDWNMISVPSRQVAGPTLVFRTGAKPIKPKFPSWKVEGSAFYDTRRAYKAGLAKAKVHFMHVSDSREDDAARSNYQKQFIDHHAKTGMQPLEHRFPDLHSTPIPSNFTWAVRDLANKVMEFQKQNVHLLVLFLPNKNAMNAGRHAVFRAACEQVVGIQSAVLCEDSMSRSKNNFASYFSKVMLKLNLRLGNINHILGPDHLKAVRSETADCVILGADVAHPSGGSKAPSIAAVVGSVDNTFAIYPGTMRWQTGRQEEIEQMESMAKDCLMNWIAKNGRLPRRILYYRDGVGESYYQRIRDTEIRKIRLAWDQAKAEFEKSKGTPLPPQAPLQITAVIVAKRHNTRFYPFKETSANNGNVPPGTVVESGITSPYFMDFYLQSHVPMAGTGKPTHYFVIENEMNLSARALQDLTNSLCWSYERSTGPVSYAPPAYYADRLCERGRQYLKQRVFDNEAAIKDKNATELKDFINLHWYKSVDATTRPNKPWHPVFDQTMFWM